MRATTQVSSHVELSATDDQEREFKKTYLSPALAQAMREVKEHMTDPQKALVLQREAKVAMEKGDHNGAIEILGHGISYNPTLTSLYLMRASCHKTLDLFVEAYFDYSYAIRLEPDSGAHYCNRSMVLAKLRRISLALEDANVCVELDPTPGHYFSRGYVHAINGDFLECIADISRALLDEGGISVEMKVKCTFRRALAFFELANYEKCIEDVMYILTEDSNHIPARALLGRSLKMMYQYKQAEEQLDIVITIDESQAAHYLERGDIKFRTGEKNKIIEAVYDFDKAIKLLEHAPPIRERRRQTVITTPLPSPSKRHDSHEHSGLGAVAAAIVNDEKEVLAEAYFRRAQAKLLLDVKHREQSDEGEANKGNDVLVHGALSDAQQAISRFPNDDEYRLVAAVSLMRLRKYRAAIVHLQEIIRLDPNHDRALYHLSFCQRAEGLRKDAIGGLTKIISHTKKLSIERNSLTQSQAQLQQSSFAGRGRGSTFAPPLERVYEMRGTLFHEMQVPLLASRDLGRAILSNPNRAETFYLRGDAQSKLGNYEQALADFNLAEELGFSDMYSLRSARGSIYRLLGDSAAAARDISAAFKLLRTEGNGDGDEANSGSRIRMSLLLAICLIDTKEFSSAETVLESALTTIRRICSAGEDDLAAARSIRAAEEACAAQHDRDREGSDLDLKIDDLVTAVFTSRKLEWLALYHLSLAYYSQLKFSEVQESLRICVGPGESASPDEHATHQSRFFYGLALSRLNKLAEAEAVLSQVLLSKWATGSPPKHALCLFALAKIYQLQHHHSRAIQFFTEVLAIEPDNAHAFFRRAWSYKATSKFDLAGEDFEKAKRLHPDDPNFAVDYKRIGRLEYIELDSEPDLIIQFPSLL